MSLKTRYIWLPSTISTWLGSGHIKFSFNLIKLVLEYVFCFSEIAFSDILQDEEKDDELLKIPKELWAVKKTEDCDFWFLKSG